MIIQVFPIFAPLQPEKSRLQPFSLLGTYASTLYIGKSLKPHYLPFAAVFLFVRQKVSVLPFEYLCSRFLADNVCQYYLCFWYACKHISSKFNPWFDMQVFVYLCNIEMYIYAVCYDKQKTLWESRVFQHLCCKCIVFLLFVFSLLNLFKLFRRKRKQKRKSHFLMCFCLKTSVFVANKTLIFSDLQVCGAKYTPPPRFWHSQGGSALLRIFLFFYFLFL